jgi:hypothetical protein
LPPVEKSPEITGGEMDNTHVKAKNPLPLRLAEKNLCLPDKGEEGNRKKAVAFERSGLVKRLKRWVVF